MYLEHTALPYEIFIMIDYVWKKFWRLLVIEEVERVYTETRPSWFRRWLCKCDCGKEKIVLLYALWRSTKSCWCYNIELKTTHWLTTKYMKNKYMKIRWHPIYIAWDSMKSRCKFNKLYVDKWVKVCKKRYKFENFYNDMIETRKEWLSLDRINNDGNYSKNNCRWATKAEQNDNTSRNIFFNYNWEIITQKKLAIALWVWEYSIRYRIRKWFSKEEVINYFLKQNNLLSSDE